VILRRRRRQLDAVLKILILTMPREELSVREVALPWSVL
jgi:hypothetical protein